MPLGTAGCAVCGDKNETGKACAHCKPRVRHLDRASWATSYGDTLARTVITHCKYFGEKGLATPLGIRMIPPLENLLQTTTTPRADIILIPIPLHTRKKRERGFNQSELIAREISTASSIPLVTHALVRTRYTPPQVKTRSEEERRQNILGAFSATNASHVRGKTVILIDDVLTTGSTANDAARALKEAGAKEVWALVVAKG